MNNQTNHQGRNLEPRPIPREGTNAKPRPSVRSTKSASAPRPNRFKVTGKQNENSNITPQGSYDALTLSLAWQLAAPQTWAAALTPVLLSITYCGITYSGKMNLLLALVLLAICVFMQSAANVFNDYADYKKGTDSLENSSKDAFDAVLVYNKLNPKAVLALGIGYLAVAGALGIYIVYATDFIPLIIGVVGALTIVLYSGGKTPISHLPIGEFVSGIVMGGLIPLACCYVLSGVLEPLVLLVALPCIIGIGLIMATNNTCDIEKDLEAGRKTLAGHLGRTGAVNTYRAVVVAWIVVIVAIIGIFYSAGMPVVAIMLLSIFPTLRALFKNPMIQASRDGAMAQIGSLNIALTAFYCLALACSKFIVWM